MTHQFGEDENVYFAHSADGHYAFVGRVLDGAQSDIRELTKAFDAWVDAKVHPSPEAASKNEPPAADLHFFVREIPQAKAATTP